jgi:predicted transcriptional regulator
MSGKQNALIEYIEALEPGVRVSVRNLARDLGVSEGTAYKAIKQAQSLGLVETRPRAGTVRVEPPQKKDGGTPLLSGLLERLGISVLAGLEHAREPVGAAVLGDGSPAQFRAALSQTGGSCLCLVGDRPDIIREAILTGTHIILTGGAQISQSQLMAAEAGRICVAACQMGSLPLLELLRRAGATPTRREEDDRASSWMRTPPYLYYNDIVADWHRLYRPVFRMSSRCAVVDDELKVCGTVDAAAALASTPSRKISSLYAPDMECFTADEATPMEELAEKMIAENSAVAYITRGSTLLGMITAGDVLRYYRYGRSPKEGEGCKTPVLEDLDSGGGSGRRSYTVRLPEESGCRADGLFSVLMSAARRRSGELMGKECALESGTFYALESCRASEVTVSCEPVKNSPSGCVLLTEIYDDTGNYARGLFTVSPPGNKTAESGESVSCLC